MFRDGIRFLSPLTAVASLSDADEILALQRLAFVAEAEIYNDFSIAPLVQTLEELKRDFSAHIFIKKVINGKIVGSAKGCVKDDTCHVGRLIVHPQFQNRGIGSGLMREMENIFESKCTRFEIFTAHKSEKNLYLYAKLGFEAFHTKTITPDLRLVFMEKHVVSQR